MAYCQPGVAAFFNFEIADEPGLGGWQSGLLWTDFTPKPSYQPFKDAVRTVASRQVDCARYASSPPGRPPAPRSASPRAGQAEAPTAAPPKKKTVSDGRSPSSRALLRVIVRSLAEAEAFTTADGSTIRELLGLPTAPVRNQSLAEATLEPGQATERHYHAETEEIYYLVEGSGEMELDGDRRTVVAGRRDPDPARRMAPDHAPARSGCASSAAARPPYRHEDTFFE